MTALQLQLQGLRRLLHDGGAEQAASAKVDKAMAQVQRLVRLVDDILDVSRITSGHLHLRRTEFDLAAAAGEVVDTLARDASKARCEVTVVGEPVVGRWDRLRVDQVLTNLLSNAFRYAPGKPVSVRIEPGELGARFTVEDHGPGIAAEDVDRIFDRFERGSASAPHGGLGLGLFISREIVQAHGGTLGVVTAGGSGAAFVVDLPLRDRVGSASRPDLRKRQSDPAPRAELPSRP
jgi:signal transduction histidine kinase